MTEYLNDDFEGASPWDATHETNGTFTYGSIEQANSPTKSGKAVLNDVGSAPSIALVREDLGNPDERFFRTYLYISSFPPTDKTNVLNIMIHGSATNPTFYAQLGVGAVDDGGTKKWRVRYAGTSTFISGAGGGSLVPTTGIWYCVEIWIKKAASGTTLKVWIDNSIEGSPSWSAEIDTTSYSLAAAYLGAITSQWNAPTTVYVDDAVIADAFIGEEEGEPPAGQPRVIRGQQVAGMKTYQLNSKLQFPKLKMRSF